MLSTPVPDISTLSISSIADYYNFEFPGKAAQKEQVVDLLDQQGFIPDTLLENEVDWFYEGLGIDDYFFSKEVPETIANVISTLYASKLESFAQNLKQLKVQKSIINDSHAMFLDTDNSLDSEIDSKFLDNTESHYRLISFLAENSLKLSFVYQNEYPKDPVSKSGSELTTEQLTSGDIDSISDVTMITMTSQENKKLYGQLIHLVSQRDGPVIKTFNSVANANEVRMCIAFKRSSTTSYYSAVSSLLNYYQLKHSKLYVDTFSNDVSIISIYLDKTQQDHDILKELRLSLLQVEREASLLYAIPHNSFKDLYNTRVFSPQEAIYTHIGAIFINHFINRLGSSYDSLIKQLNVKADDTLLNELLANLKRKLRTETYTQQMIIDVLHKYKEIVSKLYKSFAQAHYPQKTSATGSGGQKLQMTLSYQRLTQLEPFKNEEEFNLYLNKIFPNDSPDLLILKTLNLFNKSILKTNFFITRKVAISFKLKSELILPKSEYPETPYGIFFVVGNSFKGFHIRFRDIARGGIRIVVSRSQDVYEKNSKSVIDENYGLASTQQKKNKDIPEGGSKGVILLNPGLTSSQDTFNAFSQYVDSIIDILIKDPLKENYVDLYGKEEILFFGPDEGTAGFTNWATLHAKRRGCSWWKSFLTGKTSSLGGIPHDEYGMTSLSVRAYVNSLAEKAGFQNEKTYKFQTGGPDGDLGSNEILLSTDNEVYLGIVDGSGVLCDPEGLEKTELKRLAKERVMSCNYDKSKLSKRGFFVSVDDIDVMLPNGSLVANGTTFRNTFHYEVFKFVNHIDLFVPCGGRPNSIDLNNLHYFINKENNKCKIPYIVEGANLFISQPAKLELERHGAVLVKDASANKGGVTSSSMEVLAALSLNDDDFVNKFVSTDNKTNTELYKSYVKEIQEKVQFNARQEFKQLWQLNKTTGLPMSHLSNVISETINKLNDDLIESDELWSNDLKLRNYLLLNKIIPKLLTNVAGPEQILKNIPDSYLKALLSSYLSSHFVYEFGIDVNMGKFLEFIGNLKRDANNLEIL